MPEELTGHVIGSEATLWSEYMPDPRVHDYQSWPRLAAFCETVWSAPDRDYAEFLPRLTKHLERLDALGWSTGRWTGRTRGRSSPRRSGARTRTRRRRRKTRNSRRRPGLTSVSEDPGGTVTPEWSSVSPS